MRLFDGDIAGVKRVEIDPHRDERGFFARTWCAQEFAAAGLSAALTQMSTAYTSGRGTLRGVHFQMEPYWEEKLVRCTQGAAYVVAVDLRPSSPTYCRWQAFELSAENRSAVYVPKGCAQGYQTLIDNTELLYCMSTPYEPAAGAGVRFDDEAFHIHWPLDITQISPRDLAWPKFQP